MLTTCLETPRLNLRPFAETDLEALAPLLAHPEVMRFSVGGPCTTEEACAYLARILKSYEQTGLGFLAAIHKQEQKLIGLIGLVPDKLEGIMHVELAFRLAPEYQNQGLASEGAAAVRDYAFGTLGLQRLVSFVDPSNTPSAKLCQRLGMYISRSAIFHGCSIDVYEIENAGWTLPKVVEALEKNLQQHMTYFVGHVRDIKQLPIKDAIAVQSHIPDDTFNYVLAAHFTEANAPTRIAEIVASYQAEKLPFTWWVGPSDTPVTLQEALKKQGLKRIFEDIAMYFDLRNYTPNTECSIQIKRVQTLQQLAHYAAIVEEEVGTPDLYETFFQHIPRSLYTDRAPLEFYVGYQGDEPVVTGLQLFGENVGGIYYVITKPEHRRKGYARAVMEAMHARAKAQGVPFAVLQASEMGLHLYKKMGYRICGSMIEYG